MNTVAAQDLKVDTKVQMWNKDFTVTGVTTSPYDENKVFIMLRDERDCDQRLLTEGYTKVNVY